MGYERTGFDPMFDYPADLSPSDDVIIGKAN